MISELQYPTINVNSLVNDKINVYLDQSMSPSFEYPHLPQKAACEALFCRCIYFYDILFGIFFYLASLKVDFNWFSKVCVLCIVNPEPNDDGGDVF